MNKTHNSFDSDKHHNTHDFFYELPAELIAQTPLEKRNHSRLLTLDKLSGALGDDYFFNLEHYLQPGDCLILNDSRVLPARIYGYKIQQDQEKSNAAQPQGGLELLLLHKCGDAQYYTLQSDEVWEVLAGPGKRAKIGDELNFDNTAQNCKLSCEVLDITEHGNRIVKFSYDSAQNDSFFSVLEKIGEMPLPHYITEKLSEKERYQTVYSNEMGSAAAPTAGLHFTKEQLEKIKQSGINIGYVTLHVGLGTFRPVKVDNILKHKMHSEHYYLPQKTTNLIKATKQNGGRVFAVGTTAARTLESVGSELFSSDRSQWDGWTDIFIHPGYNFTVIDGLLTNFHLPESTLIMLVSALAGYENTMKAYKHAVWEKYRFFSFGDAMLIC